MDAVALAMIEALPVTAPTVGWQTLVNANQRSAAATSTDGTRIYYSHGATSTNAADATLNIVTTNGQILTGPSGSVARKGAAGAWCNGKHYAIGGVNGNGQVQAVIEAYTPAGANGASGVWSTMSPGFSGAAYMAAAVIGQYVYFGGGQAGGVNDAVSNFYRYDTASNVVTGLALMPTARTQGAMVPVGTKLCYLGGLDSSGSLSRNVYIFDTAAGTWSTGTALGFDMGGAAAAVVNGVAYATNGTGVNAYNITTGTSTLATATTPASHGAQPGLVAISSALYYVSGTDTANVDKFDLGAGTGYTAAVLGVKSLLNPLLAGVASVLPNTPPTVAADRTAYAQNVQTLKALAAL